MNSKYVPEGTVFLVPVEKKLFSVCQIWTLDKYKAIAICGITNVISSNCDDFNNIVWSDPKFYFGYTGLLISDVIGLKWKQIGIWRPALRPRRYWEGPGKKILYDLDLWRPPFMSFVSPQLFINMIKEVRRVADGGSPSTYRPFVNSLFLIKNEEKDSMR